MVKKDERMRKPSEFHDGFSDRLTPLNPLDLTKCKTVSDLVAGMAHCSFGARSVGEGAEVLQAMVEEEGCFKVLTMSGAMTPAKMGLVVCDMIDWGMVDAVVTTGAIMAHGMVEGTGRVHFKHRESMKDVELYRRGYNRIYDTIELESSLDDMELIFRKVMEEASGRQSIASYEINWLIGKALACDTDECQRGILKSAYQKQVPVYVPAFTDSELGLDFGVYLRRMKLQGKKAVKFDAYADLEDYTERVRASDKLGIFTVGGGVPRNWGQQVGPYLDIIQKRVGTGGGFKRFDYAIRVCPEPAHWGGLSGCTYSEGVSWGKIRPQSEGGRYVEVLSDATIAWPLIVKAVMERLEKKGFSSSHPKAKRTPRRGAARAN